MQWYNAMVGRELGVYDFATNEVSIIKDIWQGATSSSPKSFLPISGKVVFLANDGVRASELWITDGSTDGTSFLKDTNPGTQNGVGSANAFFLDAIGSDLVLFVTPKEQHLGNAIWKTNGTEAATSSVVDLGPSAYLSKKGNDYYFLQGRKIVKQTGVSGTVEVLKDLTNVINGTQVYTDFQYTLGDNVIFELGTSGGSGALGTEYWISDGTVDNTHVLKDINPGSANAISGLSKGLKMSESLIVFPANDGAVGRELWRTDGTESGTVRVKDIFGGNSSSNPNHFALLNGKAYFQADDGIHGKELWVSDGTESGTTLLKDISDGADGSSPQFLTTVGESIFFTAFQAAHGWALWKTDGTENGTVLVKDLHPSTENSFALLNLTNVNGTLYFAGNDGSHGEELWTSDGTESGTKLIDIIPGSASSYPYGMTAVGSLIYLRANNELWRYAPHLQISERVSDMFPLGMIFHQNELYFGAQSKLYGAELFKTPIAEKFGQGLVFSPIENKIEGGSSFTLSATSKTSSPIIYSSTSDKISISGNTVTLLKPGAVTIKATQAGDSNFNAAEQTQTFCINPSKPIITQSNANSPKPTLISNRSTGNTWKFSSVDIGDGAELIIEKSGTYTLTASVENCVSEPATIDIPKVDQIITFPLEDKTLETGSFTLNATANSGLPITYEVNNDVLSITGGTATITKAGSVTITAKQAGDDLFNPSELSKAICITPSKPTISVSTVSGVPHLSSSYADGNSWLLNGSPLSLTGSSLVVSSAGVYNVKVTIDGCSSSLSDNVTIEKLSPSITFELADQPFESGTFTLVGSASSGKDVSFTTTSSKVVLAGKVATIKEPGKVTITASTPSDALYNSAEVERTICILPAKPTISVTDPFAGGQTITSSASSGNQWYLNGSAITSAIEKDLKVSASGNYSVQVSIETCASPMSEPISMVVTGLMAESSASIFPNPAEKYVTIRVGSSEMIRGYQVINSSGVVVKSESVNQTQCTIDVEHFTPGIYAIAIQSERAFMVTKFAKK
ncbi:MAG: ELWxxDGT repeat protein [Bacteroidota bacterium]